MTESQNTGKEDFLDLSVLVLPHNPVAVFLGLFRAKTEIE
jgi:hypothetical protein